ncbi:MAG: hypothetical protein ACRDHY_03295 [Anaerolineales bacterium]
MAQHEAHDAHHSHGNAEACPHCLADPRRPGSAKVAWAIAGIAVAALLVVLFLGIGSSGGNIVAFTALPLLAVLACPLVMGGMMWMMMRKQH